MLERQAAGQGTGVDATLEDQQRSGRVPDGLWRRGDGTNLVGGFIAGTDFNAANRLLHIAGVREMNGPLFCMLEETADAAEASEAFSAYRATMFGALVQAHRQFRFEPLKGTCTGYIVDTVRIVLHDYFLTDGALVHRPDGEHGRRMPTPPAPFQVCCRALPTGRPRSRSCG